MKSSLLACALASAVALAVFASSDTAYRAGDSFVGFSAPDQKGKVVTFTAGDARFVLFDTPGESGEMQPPKDPAWFEKNHAWLIVNISELSWFKRRVARSRMEGKPFRMLVVDDSAIARKFPRAKGKISVLTVDHQGKIGEVKFAAPGDEVQAIVTGK
jgi:hypothetical protein